MFSLTHGLMILVAMITGVVQSDSMNGTSNRTDVLDPTAYVQYVDPSSVREFRNIPKPTASDHYFGNKDAEVVLIEYIDTECPFCQRSRPTMKKLIQHYDGKVGWVVRHYPLDFHTYAKNEAEATECVTELAGEDAFWKYTDDIFAQSKSGGKGLAPSRLTTLAVKQGIKSEDFKKCMDSDRQLSKVEQQMKVAAKAGVSGTPTTIIVTKDGRRGMIMGAQPYEMMQNQIDPFVGKP